MEVSDHTGFPEMMDGRVKTLHPRIHGGILGRRGTDDEVMSAHEIPPIDLVVVNLYPFEATVARPDCTLEDAVENIDIGGPTMVRAAAKNHRDVAIVVSSDDYGRILAELESHDGHTTLATRFDLAIRAYEHTAAYDGMIANHFGCLVEGGSEAYPRTFNLQFEKVQEMRYGENPHQSAAFYREARQAEVGISSAEQLQGKALSYNNLNDADAAFELVSEFEDPAVAIIKHANPCGVALGDDLYGAYRRALACDETSAFGGIVACNRPLDGAVATAITEIFTEVVIAPDADDAARAVFAQKPNLRLVLTGSMPDPAQPGYMVKSIAGGLLVQSRDAARAEKDAFKIVTASQPDETTLNNLVFAQRVAKHVKSNTIVLVSGGATLGVGAGQMSRVDAAHLAIKKAGEAGLDVAGAVAASDAFFPFADGIQALVDAGVKAVVQPGGSMRDDEVIAAAEAAGMSMVFTGTRHFRH